MNLSIYHAIRIKREWISRKSGIPESKIAEYEEEKKVFHSTGRLPSRGSAYGFICGTSMTTYS